MNKQELLSVKYYKEAVKLIPGGVNSPVRACYAVGANPSFVKKGKGARIWDVDENEYIDYIGSWGPLIFGHVPSFVNQAIIEALQNGTTFGAATFAEIELAKLINQCVPSVEMVRLVNSGTEAAMSAIRLARGFTKRDKIIKFAGGYHGHADSLLVAAGSGVATLGIPGSPGIPKQLAELTITVPYNDLEAVKSVFEKFPQEIAAVIVEPVAGNMGLVLPVEGFLKGLIDLCKKDGSVFICDEVITGFRVSLGGAQKLFNIKPDLTILGKIIGGGLPLAAFGGRSDIMSHLAPVGDVYQAGTLSGNPLAVAAGIAAIKALKAEPNLYDKIKQMSESLSNGLLKLSHEYGFKTTGNQIASLSTLFFTKTLVTDYKTAKTCETSLYASFWRGMHKRGVWLAPSQFESNFISAAHTPTDIDTTLGIAAEVFKEMKNK